MAKLSLMDHPKAPLHVLPFLLLLLLLLPSPPAISVAAHHDFGVHRNYLIIVRKPYRYNRSIFKDVSSWHASLLASVCDSAKDELAADPSAVPRLIYSYRNVVNGFAARVTHQELDAMSKTDWFVRAIPDRTYKLMTTHTPQVLGLTGGAEGRAGVWNESNMGEGIIIGVLDDGITPGHPSFDGKGMPPPPAKWRGRCDFNSSMCNNKLIGARSFFESAKWKWKGLDDPVLPINESSHGTHTASTAAGAFVPGANILGNALGTAAGMAPRAHVAFYQVCFDGRGCDRDDILAAMDDAVEDGVDVLSLSLGDDETTDFAEDPVALGGFTAIMKGVFVSTAAGNTGPRPSTVANEAPWLLTVAAGTTDRRFLATVKLGNGLVFDGETLYQPSNFGTQLLPLVADTLGDGTCADEGILASLNVQGKLVLCQPGGNMSSLDKGRLVLRAGAAGMLAIISGVWGPVIVPKPHVLPAVQVTFAAGQRIKAYVHSTPNPTAAFAFKGTVFNSPRSPTMAPFSSRGPSRQSQGVLKPDILGPGVNILAGVPKPDGIDYPANADVPKFDIKSGTSMATPHLTGTAALLKRAHPDWSPAAIKSAMMTTTDLLDTDGNPITNEEGFRANYFAIGAGYVNPARALDPGLVYNMTAPDYVPYLCGLGYSDHQVNSVIHPAAPVACAQVRRIEEKDLNYPSITAILDRKPHAVKIRRAVTNVGDAEATYEAVVSMLGSVLVRVKPAKLRFTRVNQVRKFTVYVKSMAGQISGTAEGQLKWVSEKHAVRSPVLVSSGKFFSS